MEEEYRSLNFMIRPLGPEDKPLLAGVAAAENSLEDLYPLDPDMALELYWNILWTEDGDRHFAVFSGEGDFLGKCSLQTGRCEYPELSIILVKDYQGRGYGERILREWLPWLRESLGLWRIDLLIARDNQRSRALFHKLGAVLDQEGVRCRYHIDLTQETTR